MEIGISTASFFNKMETEDALLDIGKHHVSLCEIFLNSFCEYTPEFTALLKGRIHKAGLKVYSVHPMGAQFEAQLFSLQDRQRGDALKIYEGVLTCCKELGASYYVMHGPASLSGAARNIGVERVAPIFSDLADMARGYGVQLTLENVSWCIFSNPAFGEDLLSRLETGKLKLTLDIKQAIRSGNTPLSFIDRLGSEMVNLHLCGAVVRLVGSYSLRMPGEGNVDFIAIRNALLSHGYTGPGFIEVYSDMFSHTDALYDCRARMEALLSTP